MMVAAGDRDRASQPAYRDRRRAAHRGAVAELALGVVAPTFGGSPHQHRTRVTGAGSDPALKWPTHVWEQILGIKTKLRPHGSVFEYRSIETDILAFCMERVAGKRLAQLVSEELWQKLGVDENACFTVDRAGYALADGGFNATLRDHGRFGQMVLSGGQGIVPSSWIEETRTANHMLFGEPYSFVLPKGGYHNQFWVEDPTSRNLLCRGVFGQLIYIDFSNEMVAVKLSTWTDFLNTKMAVATLDAVKTVSAQL